MTAKGLSAEYWHDWNCNSQWRASPGLAPHWFRKAWMSRCTSERPAGGARVSGGAGGGVHHGSSAAGDWTRSSALSAFLVGGWARAQAVLSRRPGLVFPVARRRALQLSLRPPALPCGPRSLPPTAAVRRVPATHTVAMATTKPYSPPQESPLCLERRALEGS
jgi:hypothetical protein